MQIGTGKISSEETSVAKELALVVIGHRAKDIITLSLEICSRMLLVLCTNK